MIGAAGRMVLVVLGLLLVLTYLLLRGAAPDAALHERRLRAIDALVLNEAALQRDVLRASHGLLLNYDPLVATVRTLREVAEELRGVRGRAASSPLIESIAAGLDEQEALVEDFKSAHALLRNSLTYFGHLSRELGASTSQAGEDMALAVGRLANSVFRFVGGSADAAETGRGRRTAGQALGPRRAGCAQGRRHRVARAWSPDSADAPGRGRHSGAFARDARLDGCGRAAGSVHRRASPRRAACLDLSRAPLPRVGGAADLPQPPLFAAARQRAYSEDALGFRASDCRHLGAIGRYAARSDRPRRPARARAAWPPHRRGSRLRRPPERR